MTSSKIQKMRFFLFLLIFLLAQTAASEGSFRERRNEAVENKDRVEDTGGKINEQSVVTTVSLSSKNTNGQQAVVEASVNAKTKPAADANNRTHNITSKVPDVAAVAVANKTAHVADTSDEVCFVGIRDCMTR